MPLTMTMTELDAFMHAQFPQVAADFAIDTLEEGELVTRLLVGDRHLRPGGTVSGPAMFALADVSVYLAILARVGPKALTVTTNCSIDFLRKPVSGLDLIARTRILKLGRVLAVGDVLLFSGDQGEPVARATLTYSIPPK